MSLRFLIAQTAGKTLEWFLRSVMHRGTNKPGEIALRICPDALSRYVMPPLVICVTGTNGKTSTSNLITHLLRQDGRSVANNAKGSNMANGLVTTLCANSTLRGKVKTDAVVLEVDERSSQYIYPHLTPTYILCTNLFRDSIKRNGHSEFIFEKMQPYLPKTSTLVLNANDAISGLLGHPENPRVFFGVEQTSRSTSECPNHVCDILACPRCHQPLAYRYFHYHHIGQPVCEACGFAMPEPSYVAGDVDFETGTFQFRDAGGQTASLPFASGNLFHVFNVTAAATLCRLVGVPLATIAREIPRFSQKLGRFEQETIHGRTLVKMLFKNQNPVSGSQCLSYLDTVPGEKDAILLVTDSKDAVHGPEDISWLYDTDFEFLNRDEVRRILVGGTRCYDVGVRLELAGIDPEKVILYPDYAEMNQRLLADLSGAETIAVFFELYATPVVNAVRETLWKGADSHENH